MEGFFAEKPNNTELFSNSEQIDLTLKLSPCGQNAEEKMVIMDREKAKNTMVANVDKLAIEGEKGLVRFGDLQTMRRVRSGKRLLLEKLRKAAAVEPNKSLPHSIHEFNTLPVDSMHEGGASSNSQTSTKQENNSMFSPKAMQEMPLWPSESQLESPAKKLKHVYPYSTNDAKDILRQMPSVTTTGDGPTGKRIEGLLCKYKRDQVCIVCVCHGTFLSPAEFVMHAGGDKEVTDPMKRIAVCSNSFDINGDGAGFITLPF